MCAKALPGHGTSVSVGAGMRNRKFFWLLFCRKTGKYRTFTTHQSASLTAPLTQGSLWVAKASPGRAVTTITRTRCETKVLLVTFLFVSQGEARRCGFVRKSVAGHGVSVSAGAGMRNRKQFSYRSSMVFKLNLPPAAPFSLTPEKIAEKRPPRAAALRTPGA